MNMVLLNRNIRNTLLNVGLGLFLLSPYALETSAQARVSHPSHPGRGIAAIFSSMNGTALDFGRVPIGQKEKKVFSFENTGGDTLFLQSLELSSYTEFTIQFASLTLPPGRRGTVVVEFAPVSEQSYQDTLSFAVANGVVPPLVALHGQGTSPEDTALPGAPFATMNDSSGKDSH